MRHHHPRAGEGPSGWPEPFLRAKEILEPILLAAGLRFLGADHDGGPTGHAMAEYRRRGERLRLVWEGRERVLWLETAREQDAQIVSRWTDIEWILAGSRLPLNPDTGDERMAELVIAIAQYLDRGSERTPPIPRLEPTPGDVE